MTIPHRKAKRKTQPHRTPRHSDSTPVKHADMREYLAHNPIPPPLKHLEPYLYRVSLKALVEMIINAKHMGLTDDQISEGVRRMAEFDECKTHRCACCLSWVTEYHALGMAGDGEVDFVALCVACADKIDRGAGTNQMRRNFVNYAIGGRP